MAATNNLTRCNCIFHVLPQQRLLEETLPTAPITPDAKVVEIARDTQSVYKPSYLCRQQAEESRRLKERFASNISHELYPAQYHSGIHRDYAPHTEIYAA